MGPGELYYDALVGSWEGSLSFAWKRPERRIGEAPPFVLAVAAFGPALGRMSMATTLARDGDHFVHTTRVRKLGAAIFETRERIAVDGARLRMAGEQIVRGRRQTYEAHGEIDADSGGATYRIPWAGVELVQRTRRVSVDELELTQETPWTRARVLLVRARGRSEERGARST